MGEVSVPVYGAVSEDGSRWSTGVEALGSFCLFGFGSTNEFIKILISWSV